jgi:anti-sigma factor RsiW
MKMDCKNTRKILFKSEYPEIVSDHLLSAKRHVKECSECTEFLEGERLFSVMLRKAIKKEPVPQGLKDHIVHASKQEKKQVKTMLQWVGIAASVLFLVVTGYFLTGSRNGSPFVKEIVNDHVQFVLSPGIQISSSDLGEVKKWFRDKVDFAVAVPAVSAKLKGGRLCLLGNKRLALLFYEHSGSQISLFISDSPDLRVNVGKEVVLNNRQMHLVEDRGYNSLFWQEKGLTYILVSELTLEEIKKII